MDPTSRGVAGRLPRWCWFLPLVAIAAWWPISPYWQSDDFLALHYADRLGRVLSDFAGPQYGATDIWLFYRPLITSSFWFDRLVAGADPWWAHFSNVLAHGASTLLVGLVWLRFLAPVAAGCAALLWAVQPSHAGSILWTVGRVDSHTTVWCLLSVWLLLRGLEGCRRSRWLSVLALLLALSSKELAFAVPPLCLLMAIGRSDAPVLRDRLMAGLEASLPHFAVLLAFLVFRNVVLGTAVGGYQGAGVGIASALGLAQFARNLVNPLWWSAGVPEAVRWAGFLPIVAAVAWHVRAARRRLVWVSLWFLCAALPAAPFWIAADSLHNLRYFYLPWFALAGILAAAGPWTVALAVLVALPALVAVRADYLAADQQSAAMHQSLLATAGDQQERELFVAGLPHAGRNGTVVQLHYGIDRLLEPPFGPGTVRLYALRPLGTAPRVVNLGEDSATFALPEGRTLRFTGSTALVPAERAELPDLTLAVEGGTDLTGDAIPRLASNTLIIRIATPGLRPEVYRITFFTACGYLSAVVPDHGAADDPSGHLDLLRFFKGATWTLRPSRLDPMSPQPVPSRGEYVLTALEIPATHDLSPEFPVLVEAGTLTPGGDFTATHRARRFLRFRLDRGYPAAVRSVLGG